jgi:hypothetical protein
VPLSGEAVSLIVKERVAAAGFAPSGYSGQSLKRSTGQSVLEENPTDDGHPSDAMLDRYIRDGELFTDNAVGLLL